MVRKRVVFLIAVLAIAVTACQGQSPGEGDGQTLEPWEEVLRQDDRFNGKLSSDDISSLCAEANTALAGVNSSNNLDVDFTKNSSDSSCGGSVGIVADSTHVALTGHLSFSPLADGEQQDLAKLILDEGEDVDECTLTEVLVSGLADPREQETAAGPFCTYVEGESGSYSAHALGAFVAGNTVIKAEFSATNDEAESNPIQEGAEEALLAAMKAMRAEAP